MKLGKEFITVILIGMFLIAGCGKTTEVEFAADKKGTFTFACSVPCGSGHGGMKGQLVVK